MVCLECLSVLFWYLLECHRPARKRIKSVLVCDVWVLCCWWVEHMKTCLSTMVFSMEIVFSMVSIFLQAWLTYHTFYPCLLVELMQEPFPKCLSSLFFLQKLCALKTSHSPHSCLQPKFSWQHIPAFKLNIFITSYAHHLALIKYSHVVTFISPGSNGFCFFYILSCLQLFSLLCELCLHLISG